MSDEPTGNSTTSDAAPPSPDAPPPPADAPFYKGFSDSDLAGWVEAKFQGSTPSVEQMANSYRNLEKLLGADRAGRTIELPGPDAQPEAWGQVYDRLGRPKSAEDYTVPEGLQVHDERLAAGRAKAHELGLTDKQFQELTKWDSEFVQTYTAQMAEQRKEEAAKAERELRQEWGAAYDQRVTAINNAAKNLGMESEQLEALRNVMGPKAAMKFVYDLSTKLGEDVGSPSGGTPRAPSALSPDAARDELSRLMGDKTFLDAWQDKAHPQHQWAIDKKAALSRQIAGISE